MQTYALAGRRGAGGISPHAIHAILACVGLVQTGTTGAAGTAVAPAAVGVIQRMRTLSAATTDARVAAASARDARVGVRKLRGFKQQLENRIARWEASEDLCLSGQVSR